MVFVRTKSWGSWRNIDGRRATAQAAPTIIAASSSNDAGVSSMGRTCGAPESLELGDSIVRIANFTAVPMQAAARTSAALAEFGAVWHNSALGLQTGGFTDALAPGVLIKAVHFQEIRNRVK